MFGGIDPVAVAFVLPVVGAAAIGVYEWWSGEPCTSVLSSALFALAYLFMFVALRGVEVLGLAERIRTVAVGLEVVFMIGAIHFLRKHQSDGAPTKEMA
ncbi:hypothetical protein [Halococcus agarilyticus]|uniref:hypothetical protein n=1 Tax=Halococcus agarilyticus TaxID=1232219 RepID=UPI00067777D4|nr:hypothetical protein [Halococcus agarilyticus]